MGVIRIVWGSADGPTATASYDAALAEAGVHNYNLVPVSSVIPADATVEVVGTAPDLGPVGGRLTVVQARATVREGRAVAGLGWSVSADGTGIFYEEAGPDRTAVEQSVETGLAAGRALREWEWRDEGRKFVEHEVGADAVATAIVLAVYGESDPLV